MYNIPHGTKSSLYIFLLFSQTYENILDFWFGSKSSRDYLRQKSFWYGSPADDAYVRENLSETYQAAKNGYLYAWIRAGEGEGALALNLLLDQVPRNIIRGAPQAYATDHKAVSVARYAIDRKWDKKLPDIQKRCMYSPFKHSENIDDQELSPKIHSSSRLTQGLIITSLDALSTSPATIAPLVNLTLLSFSLMA
ncbi:uncharacterized protein N7503_006880 [Penicillium pulvis]|uniref:uncharacterized protein n=1 Tax=Penicillium pulvis TaxID=1562058 RepID=UPI0025486E6F|nr:uncharacterized protein N7503_006880 [Penicillium pulvis]KAJ5797584.1 hypothetical protein N7503_006880 [Penicillium pulvis]